MTIRPNFAVSIDGSWDDKEVKGNSIDACLDEFFRRKGWQKAHDYLALPNVSRSILGLSK